MLMAFRGRGELLKGVGDAGNMTGLQTLTRPLPCPPGQLASRAFRPFRSCTAIPPSRPPAARMPTRALPEGPIVKICGVTNAADAAHAARQGAGLIGMIMWPRAPRYVPLDRAREVAAAARAQGSEPVGVFVSESAEEITRCGGFHEGRWEEATAWRPETWWECCSCAQPCV